jgi:hypothetical protein
MCQKSLGVTLGSQEGVRGQGSRRLRVSDVDGEVAGSGIMSASSGKVEE